MLSIAGINFIVYPRYPLPLFTDDMKQQRFRIFENAAKGMLFLLQALIAIVAKPFPRKGPSYRRSHRTVRVPHIQPPRRRTLRFICTVLLAFTFTVQFSGINLWWTNPAYAQTTNLYIEPLTWDFIGLDSNNPSVGPNSYLVGARVCNIGSSDAINTVVKFVKEGATNPYITVTALGESRTDTLVIPRLTPGAEPSDHHKNLHTPSNCFDAYYNAEVQRTSSAYNTVQRYHIEAAASNSGSVRTPINRQLYVEKILSQGRNEVLGFSGPSSVSVGEEYTFTLTTKTATAYPQLTISSNFPNAIFQFLDISTQYATPGVSNSSIYADACGWIADYTASGYHESSSNCGGTVPDRYTGGKVGDTVTTTYKIKILSTGNGASSNTLQVNHLILDFSGGSYHYNSDYGTGLGGLTISVIDRKADLSIDKSHVGNFSAGDNVYTLAVTNNGPDAAKAPLTVTDTLPTGFSYVGLDTGTSANWTCSATGQTVNCNNTGDLANGATSTIKLKVNVSASAATSTFNTATVSSATSDVNLTNNTDTDPTLIVAGANLKLTKSDGNSTANQPTLTVGGQATYTFTVTNQSSTTAKAPLTVIDTLPSGLTADCNSFTSAAGENWTCAASGQNLTFTRSSDLSGTQSTSFSLIVGTNASPIASPATSAIVTNSATVSSSTYDPATNDNTSSDTLTLTLPVSDLKISKSHNDPLVQDANGQYTITITNNGIASTTGTIKVEEQLPSSLGMSYQSHSGLAPDGSSLTWDCKKTSTTCVAGIDGTITFTTTSPLAPGQSSKILLTVKPTKTGTSVNNTVTVFKPEDGTGTTLADTYSDPTNVIVTANNENVDVQVVKQQVGTASTIDTLVSLTPTLSSSQLDIYPAVDPGSAIKYALTLTNNTKQGPDAVIFNLTDVVPSEITVSAWSCKVIETGASGQGVSTGCNPTSGSNSNTINPSITLRKNGGQVRILVTGTVKSATNLGTASSITNMASAPVQNLNAGTNNQGVITYKNDAVPLNNTYTVVTPINRTDLQLTKTDNSINFSVGLEGTYILSIKNVSANATIGTISVTDDLPDSFTYVYAGSAPGSANAGWTCLLSDATNKLVTCSNDGPLAAGATSQIQIVVKPTTTNPSPDSSFKNTATVSTSGDGVTTNNKGEDTTNVVAPSVDLAITKSVGSGTNFQVGQAAAYGITVINLGPTAAAASSSAPIRVTDTLPTGISFVSAVGAGWSCSANGQTVTCDRTTALGVNQPTSITLNGFVESNVASSVTNTTQVVQHLNEPAAKYIINDNASPSRNSHTITTPVDLQADLGIVKTLSGSLVAGQTATYQLAVTNYGPSNVSGTVTVTDSLPSGLTFSSGSGDGFTCTAGTCTKSDGLTVGQTATINLTLNVAANASGDITNTATVSSTISDPISTNNSSNVTKTVQQPITAVTLDKSHFGSFPLNGQGTYTLEVKNTGTITITDPIRIVDDLPNSLTFASALGQGWSCSGNTTVTCTTNDDLAPNTSSAVSLTVNVGASTPTGESPSGGVTNTASVFLGTSNTAAATDTDPTTITSSADLSVTKTAVGDFIVGQSATYELTVKNSATSPASPSLPITLVDQLPNGLTYVSGTGTDWTCPSTSTSSDITCTYDAALSPGSTSSTLTLTVTVTSQAGSSFTNFATVYSLTPDSDTSNNTTSVVTTTGTISSTPNLLLVKRITAINSNTTNPNDSTALNTFVNYGTNTDEDNNSKWPADHLLGATNGGQVRPADEVDYTIYFLSAGTETAKNVTICDRIPAHQTFVPDAFNSLTAAPNTAPASPPGDRGIVVSQGSTTYAYTNLDDGDTARYYPPGSTLPSACTQAADDNGAIVVNLGDVPKADTSGSPAESYGFVRFRAKVK